MAKAAKKLKKKNVKVEPQGCAYIQATFNNIIITMTNKAGQVISWCSAGKSKFRGSKRILLMQLKYLPAKQLAKHMSWALEVL